jgi:DNA-binding transcriptional LysR family regulator
MELRQIRHFIAIVEEENFALAARRVCISQPALSRSLRMLESTLQARLIERGPRRSVPSVAGERFLPHARAILADCERAKSAIRDADGHSTRLVTIGIDAPLSSWLAGRIAARIGEELPEVQLCFKEGTAEDLVGLLRAGRIQIALAALSRDEWDPLVLTEALAPLRSVVVGPRDPARANPSRDPAPSRIPSRWVTLEGLDDHVSLHQHFSGLGIGNPCVTLASSLTRLRSLIIDCEHTAFVPAQLLHAELLRGVLQVLDVEIPHGARSVGLLQLADMPRLPVTERIKAIVRDCWIAAETPNFARLVANAPASIRWSTTPRGALRADALVHRR